MTFKLKNIILLVCLLVGKQYLFSQSIVFNNLYNYTDDTSHINWGGLWYNYDLFYDAVELEDGSFLAIGQSYNEWDWANEVPHFFQNNMIIDKYGEILNEIPFELDPYAFERANQVLAKKNSFYTYGGYQDTIDGEYDILLTKFDYNGNVLWNYIKNYNEYDFITSICEKDSLLYVASSFLENNVINSIISRIDTNGNLIDTTLFLNPFYNYFTKLSLINDSTILTLGHIEDYNNTEKSTIELMSLDLDLNINWSQSYNMMINARNYPRDFFMSKDKKYIYITGWYENLVSTDYKGFIIKTNIEGDEIWKKDFNVSISDYYEGFSDIKELKDGSLAVFGNGRKTFENSVYVSNRAWLLKLDTVGDVIWERFLQRDTFTYKKDVRWDNAYGMSLTQDGGFLICGNVDGAELVVPTDLIYRSRDAWLLKADSCGFTEGDYPEPSFVLNNVNYDTKTITISNSSDRYCTATIYYGNGDSTNMYAYSNPKPNEFIYTYAEAGTYTIKLKALAGETFREYENTITFQEDTTIGIEEVLEENFEVNLFPNPTKTAINVVFNEKIVTNNSFVQIRISNMQAKTMFSKNIKTNIQKNNLDVSHLENGVYYMSFYNSENNYLGTKKFVVVK